ncbi:MAG: CDC48 family AAA ATPase [Candidatus Riflebacteria bacterium]|nr:CDC48 family AAA ATPase [Candidatus Riflebacteria bacterium]
MTSEALPRDVGRGIVRMDPPVLKELGVEVGEIVCLHGKRAAYARAMPTFPEQRGKGAIALDGLLRENASLCLQEKVRVDRAAAEPATQVKLEPIGRDVAEREGAYVASLLDGLPVQEGDKVRATLFGSRWIDFKVLATKPKAVVVIHPMTQIRIEDGKEPARGGSSLTYEDIGGLGRQLDRIREMIELPLRHPEVFTRLGITPPKGVLLAGPPGTGKTLIARAVARETEAHFFSVSGPEIIHKFYGESEAHLREIFEKAAKSPPAIIFLDEVDAIAPKRDRTVGDVEKRVVAQLLALMDGLAQSGPVIVIGATNLPDMLDPALRRHGRFDREIMLPIPDRHGRLQILEIHSRGMPLETDVDLPHLSEITHGFVGADLAALCREAAMTCLRTLIPDIDLKTAGIPYERLQKLTVHMAHFLEALKSVEPSGVREVFTEVPDVAWTDVGGLSESKHALMEAVIWPLKHRRLFDEGKISPPKGLLLAGLPGTGKTLLAKALATESGVNFISVKGPQLLSMYVGESERAVREVFRKARQAAPCILFLDEIDAVLPRRGGGGDSHVTERVVGQFLAELDGVEELRDVFILGATNRPELLDPAITRPGRCDFTLTLPVPDRLALAEIYRIHTRHRPLASDVDLAAVTAASSGMTGADAEWVCRRAVYRAIQRAVAAEEKAGAAPLLVVRADLDGALDDWRRRSS